MAIISQTTMSVEGYKKLIDSINDNFEKKFEELSLQMKDNKPYVFVDTICNPTKQRQSDTETVARKADPSPFGEDGVKEPFAAETALYAFRYLNKSISHSY